MTARFLQSTHELKTLVLSYHPLIAIQTPEEERLQALLRAVSLDLLIPHWEWSITRGLVNSADRSTIEKTKVPKLLLKHLEGITASTVVQLMDFTKHLADPGIIRQFREVAQHFSRIRATLVLSGDPLELPPELQHLAVRFDLQLPGREELAEMVKHLITSLGGNKRIPVELTAQDQERLVLALSGLTLLQARQMVAYVALDDNRLTAADIRTVIGRKAQAIRDSGVLDYVPPEENSYQLGGFANLKNWLQRAQIGFGAEAKAMNLRPPRGILIIGVQGCGKSLAAKAIAREWQLPLLKLDAAKLYDKFVGESERNFRRAIALAETMAPAVLWIDEIEKGLSSAGHSEADGGLSMRLFGSFLTWLQEHSQQVFVVATANDLSALPPELLRKGRFDEIFFVDLPDAGERRDIFLIHLGLRHQDSRQFDLDALVAASEGFSGAEIEQAVISGLYTSLQSHWPLTTESLVKELTSTIPLSVSRKEDVERLREHARGRFVRVH